MNKKKDTSDSKYYLPLFREMLLALPAAGASGFEGLVATALANLTGMTFRLAKSGSQFGRDATTPNGRFAIAMEAKRYSDNVSLENLAGKATVASLALAGACDLWIVGATSEVGDDTQRMLARLLEEKGITLLTLDWTSAPLPALAVLLASEPESVNIWFGENARDVDLDVLSAQLKVVQSHPAFSDARTSLLHLVNASEVGLDALRGRSRDWLLAKFATPIDSRISFGQLICVTDENHPPIHRAEIERKLQECEHGVGDNVVVVLGEEGTGKTWSVANWLMRKDDLPVALFVAGRRKQSLDPRFPEASLARLFAAQSDISSELAIKSWERRIERWKLASTSGDIRFLVVFDGLNEDASLPWSDIVIAFADLLRKLGGALVVTCRPVFWQRDVLPRLPDTLKTSVVSVAGYSDDELETVLRQSGHELAQFPDRTREFIRNPRVCSVALRVLISSDIQSGELTYERLLLSYWQVRLEERGNLIGHTAQDFKKLLSEHAKKWLICAGSSPFATDDWADLSGAAKRNGLESVRADLTEIEEGRFLTVVDETHYTFRPETVPFALGLLIADELKSLPKADDARESLHTILGPVAGFDEIGDILGAAVVLACADSHIADTAISAMVDAWFSLQNIRMDTYAAVGACIRQRPEAFFDAVELESFSGRHTSLANALINERDNATVLDTASSRVSAWLCRWSRKSHHTAPGNSQVQRAAERLSEIDARLNQLQPDERALFDSICFEKSRLAPISLIDIAARFLADRPLASFAEAFLGRALALAVARDLYDRNDEIEWIFRLNRRDPEETTRAIEALGESLLLNASQPMQAAVLSLYRCSGSPKLGSIADSLAPISKGERWRLIDSLCDVDPCDPDSLAPSNLQNAIKQIGNCSQLNVRAAFSTTSEDHNIETTTPSLSRFSANGLVEKWREVIESLPLREQLSLRQLIISLPYLSPLFDEKSIKSVCATFHRVAANPLIVQSDELQFMINELMMSLVPHCNVHQQLDLLQSAPATVKEFTGLCALLSELTCAEFEDALEGALHDGDATKIRRVLLFAPSQKLQWSSRAKSLICECLKSEHNEVVGIAMDVACANTSDDLKWVPIELVTLMTTAPVDDWLVGCRSRLIASIVVRQQREELLKFVQSDELAWCCAAVGQEGTQFYMQVIECAVDRLLHPISTPQPATTRLSLHLPMTSDGRATKAVDEIPRATEAHETAALFGANFGNDADHISNFATRQRTMWDEVFTFVDNLATEGASALTDYLGVAGAVKLVEQFPERVKRLIHQMLQVEDERMYPRFFNYAVPLASAFAAHDEDLCRSVFERYRIVQPIINICFHPEGIPLYLGALFATPKKLLDCVKRQVFDDALTDAELELAVVSAERFGDCAWLDGYVGELCGGDTAGRIARGLTIASLRQANPASDGHLAATFGGRFLSAVQEHARATYTKNRWAEHWFSRASKSEDPVDFWRYGNLAERVADSRFLHWCNTEMPTFRAFEHELLNRFKSVSQKRSKKRDETLFGCPAPSAELKRLLRSAA